MHPRRQRLSTPSLAAFLCAGALVLLPGVAAAQVVGGNIAGTVTDGQAGALPGATVTVLNTGTGFAQTLTTGPTGSFRAVALQPGLYEVTAELSGFATQRQEIELLMGYEIETEFVLDLAGVEETVTITAEAPLVELTKAQPSSVVTNEQVEDLPVLNRNFLALATIMPGATPHYQKFAAVKFGGAADQRNAYSTLIDGGDIDDAIWGNPSINIAQDAVQEFKVYRNQFDAQYGAALTAVVTTLTKSGTNDLSGTGYVFARDERFSSKNEFADEKPPFDERRLGATLGGPVVRDRTHFFGSVEYHSVANSRIISLPSSNPFAARENGVFEAGTTKQLALAKIDHRFNPDNALFIRYSLDNYNGERTNTPTSATQFVDDHTRAHSVVVEDNWILSADTVNTVRFHYLSHNVETTPHSFDPGINRPSVTTGQNFTLPQFFPRERFSFYETLYINKANHNIKIGGDFTTATHEFEAHFNESGQWHFATDDPFNPNDPATHPFAFVKQTPGFYDYKSNQIGLYLQDDWQVADNVQMNLGVRYDLDTNIRLNDVYDEIRANPAYTGIDNFTSADRGTDTNNLQPRVGLTWDVGGRGNLVVRGGVGQYVTRNRPWFQLTTQDRLVGSAVRISDPALLANFPDQNATLGGKSLEEFVLSGARSVFLIDDDYQLPQSITATIGVGWQINAQTSLDVDLVHSYADKQLGALDYNLPAAGRISGDNPRPISGFSEVKVMTNFTETWYDAVEIQLRRRVRGGDSLQASYTLSRSYRNGVGHYQWYPGTMRDFMSGAREEEGYSDLDNRHNFTLAGSTILPWDVQLSGIFRVLSGNPVRAEAGFDIDGDNQRQHDKPPGLAHTVGRTDVDESLRIINELRTSLGRDPIDRALLDLDTFFNVDVRVTKIFPFGAAQQIELFLEGYNLTNHVNYFGSNRNINSASFLVRRRARDARQFQGGIRYRF